MFPIPSNPKPKILIFRNELLPASETFVLAQASALHLFETCFAGVHAASNCLRLPTQPVLLDDSSSFWGKLRRRVFWRSGVAPDFHRRLQQLKPALIHAHFAIDAAAALPIAQRLRVPLVVTLHGYDVTSSDKTLSRSPEGRCYLRRRRQLWEEAAAFVCISRFLYDRALAAGFPRAKLRVHYTGTDFSLFTPSQAERSWKRRAAGICWMRWKWCDAPCLPCALSALATGPCAESSRHRRLQPIFLVPSWVRSRL
jgi:glycosyltransferase involved in cell wall biosynthesis